MGSKAVKCSHFNQSWFHVGILYRLHFDFQAFPFSHNLPSTQTHLILANNNVRKKKTAAPNSICRISKITSLKFSAMLILVAEFFFFGYARLSRVGYGNKSNLLKLISNHTRCSFYFSSLSIWQFFSYR